VEFQWLLTTLSVQFQWLCYSGPPVTVLGMGRDDGVVLLGREGAVLHGGAKLFAPSELARLAGPFLNVAVLSANYIHFLQI